MQLGRYLGQHQSFIQTPHTHTHTHTQRCAHTHTEGAAFPKCLCMGRTGVEGGNGREENKNNFFSPLPPFSLLWFYMQARLWQTLHHHETLIHFQRDTASENKGKHKTCVTDDRVSRTIVWRLPRGRIKTHRRLALILTKLRHFCRCNKALWVWDAENKTKCTEKPSEKRWPTFKHM